MQSKISTTQLELFNESALPEAVTLHADRPGFFSLLVKPAASDPRQSSDRVGMLPQAAPTFSYGWDYPLRSWQFQPLDR